MKRLVLGVLATVWLAGCASLPALDGRVASHGLTDTAGTRLAGLARVPEAHAGKEPSGIRELPSPLEAFGTRVALARGAERSLDVQYYIWHQDVTGTLLLQELWNAAGRGVRVRLLLDDNGIAGLDPMLATLNSHANIEVRLFNPFAGRRFKTLGYLTDFSRLNHRMHNKSFTADASATIVGGRNVGDEYFGATDGMAFADLDVLALGKAARDVTTAFDGYWNSESAYPAEFLLEVPGPESVPVMLDTFRATEALPKSQRYLDSVTAALRQDVEGKWYNELKWVPAVLVCDDPIKIKEKGKVPGSALMFTQLSQIMGGASESMDLVSPYFVPGSKGTRAMSDIARTGLNMRIVTNSLMSSDAMVVHAGYSKRRKDLLQAGIKIYETKPNPAQPKKKEKRKKQLVFSGSSSSSLHAKTFAVDRKRIFVGSFNLDQRSLNLNTEMGLVIDSDELASALSETLDRTLAGSAYEVRIQKDGSGLEWLEVTEQGDVVHRNEPRAGLLKRMGVNVLSWLPIDWML